ncbi:UDP-GlcNAc--UDP-phosphate GlcNAc-1-phosphate transferase [Flavobacteriaceae bacterium F08102]|nr:UDP-GlcNAc--UDP-phosphate GlcNAc-1-phosphate transferase [Flavobacteriaceae bacterium F08102]
MIYFISFVILSLLAVGYLKLADHFNIIDKPNLRSSHTIPTIRGGGIVFYFGLLVFFIYSRFDYPYFFGAVSLIAVVSFMDDLNPLGRRLRLIFHFIAGIGLLWQLQVFTHDWWLVPLYLVFIVGFFNLFNFMDGINGLTGLYSLSVLSGFLWLNAINPVIHNDLIFISMIAIVVFGFFNFRKKARWFAGDIGSMTMATILIFLFGAFFFRYEDPVLILLFVVYGVDGGLTILLRALRLENITDAHRHHLYQKFVDVGKWSHLHVSLMYATVQVLVNVLVIQLIDQSLPMQWLGVMGVVGVLSVTYFSLIRYFK